MAYIENVYPGLETLKAQYRKISCKGEKVYGHPACSRCGGSGVFGVRGVWGGQCFKCGGNAVELKGERIDEAGWTARMKARAKAAERKTAARIKREEQAHENAKANSKALGFDVVLAAETYAGNAFLSDILNKGKFWLLSDKQIEAVKKSIQDLQAREVKKAELADVTLPEGRQKIQGRVISIKTQYGPYGETTKMLIQREDGFKFFGSIPANFYPEKGDLISLEAAPEIKDAGFAIYKRPTKPAVIERGQQGQAVDAGALELTDEEIQGRALARLNGGSDAARRYEATIVSEKREYLGRHVDADGRYNPPDYL